MARNIMIITTSPRKGSNSTILADEFAAGAREAGHQVETISLREKTVQFCTGCLACQKTQRCVLHDDADAITQKMLTADVLVFATPVYFYAMCGQMKTLLDRSNPLFPSAYAFRDIYLLATAADTDESAIDGTIKEMQGWVGCFDKTRLKGVLRGMGVNGPEAVRDNPALCAAAYTMGKNA